jgi:predicted outer membrane repeat protein
MVECRQIIAWSILLSSIYCSLFNKLASASAGGTCDPSSLSSSKTHVVTSYSELKSAIVFNNAVIDIQADIIVGDTATTSGGVNILSGTTTTLFSSTKSKLIGCNCGQCGATTCANAKRQLYVSGTLRICNLVLRYGGSRTSDSNGGALHVANSGVVHIEGCTFTENGGQFGVAIYTAGEVTILNSVLSSSLPDQDGGVVAGGSIYIATTGKLTAKSTLFTSNQANGWNWSWSRCCTSGGALAVYGSFDGDNISFTSNSCPSFYGGAIYLNGGSVTLTSCTFTSNSATQGNAIYVDNGGSFTSSLSRYNIGQNVVVSSGAKKAEFCETIIPQITGSYTTSSSCLPPTAVLPSAQTFNFTGYLQNLTVPSGVYSLYVSLYGAQGSSGSPSNVQGGLGGFVSAFLPVYPGQVLFISVGEQLQSGTDSRVPFGGGGITGSYSRRWGGAGGGSSDVRTSATDLTTRLLVAGGGGGASTDGNGGAGGGPTGGSGLQCCGRNGKGGSQTAGGDGGGTYPDAGLSGVFGNGGQATWDGGGGGGGWYGGGGGGNIAWNGYYGRDIVCY